MSPTSDTAARFRFRSAEGVSRWIDREELQQAVLDGLVDPRTPVQQAGQSEWVAAQGVPGIAFAAPASVTPEPAAVTNTHVRFQTIREVLHTFQHGEIEIEAADGRGAVTMRLAAVGQDHFEADRESDHLRLFVPYGRIRLISAFESRRESALSYRDAHRLRISIDGPAPQ
jgi:hypothetical protein